MTSLPKLRVPQETEVSSVAILPQDSSPPKRSRTSVRMANPSKSLDGSTNSALFPWLKPDLPESRPTPRLDPLRPTRERTFTLSSTDAEFEKEQMMLRKKREQYHQFHRSWMRPFYGSKVDQEEYRRSIREQLKSQMAEKCDEYQKFQKDKVQESEQAFNYDEECVKKDKRDHVNKALYLSNFRNENKRIIEKNERLKREHRINTAVHEQELLRYNPVNWSQTLR